MQIRDYGDARHLILHLEAAHPVRPELQKHAAWFATYADHTGRVTGLDLAFVYDGPEACEDLKKWLEETINGKN